MEDFRSINYTYETQYAELDRLEKCGTDTTCNRLALRQNHIKALTECMKDCVDTVECLKQEKDEIERSIKDLCSNNNCLEKELSDADAIICKLKRELKDLCHEAKCMDAELTKVMQCLQDCEKERSVLSVRVEKQVDVINCYKCEIKKLSEVNEKCQQELVCMNEELRRVIQEMADKCTENKELLKKIKELEHNIAIYKHSLEKEECVVQMKNNIIEELTNCLDQAQSRIIDWQVKALEGDDAARELECLNQKITILVPELEQVCASNEELKCHNDCLKKQLDVADDEIRCLREKVYEVALECADLDSRLNKCLQYNSFTCGGNLPVSRHLSQDDDDDDD